MNEERDRFGGLKSIKFEATGFFRLEKRERWWFVTPEGNAFLSFGINHLEPNRLCAKYNIEYWSNKFKIKDNSDINEFNKILLYKAKEDLPLLGVNTLGCHTSNFYKESFMPYVEQCRFVNICHYMKPSKKDFPDVFSKDFEVFCDMRAKEQILPKKDDPYLLGISMTDCPIFTNLDAAPRINNVYGAKRYGLPTWPVVLRNLSKGAPGKQEYVILMKERYNSISKFNEVYNTAFDSFENLLMAENWRLAEEPQNFEEVDDNLEFLYKIVDRQYKVQVDAIRKYDNNHMIFGDKLNGNTNTPDEIVKLADKHMDLIFYQYYAFLDEQDELLKRWTNLTDKPFLMGDSSLSVPSKNAPDPYGPHCLSQEHRAKLFTEMFNDLFSRKYYIGWHWCGWMDSWRELQDAKQHSGLQTPFGEFHGPMLKAMKHFSEDMYDIAFKI